MSLHEPLFPGLSEIPPIPDPDPEARTQADRLLAKYQHDVDALTAHRRRNLPPIFSELVSIDIAADEVASGRRILDLDGPEQVAIIRAATDLCFPSRCAPELLPALYTFRPLGQLAGRLLRRKLLYAPQDIDWLLARIAYPGCDWHVIEMSAMSPVALLRSIERWSREHELSDDARTSLSRLKDGIAVSGVYGDGRRFIDLIDQIMGVVNAELIDPADDWGCYAAELLDGLSDEDRKVWPAFLSHCQDVSGTRPSKRWLRATADHVEAIGDAEFREVATRLLGCLDRPTRNVVYRRTDGFNYPSAYVADINANTLKGLAWALTTAPDERNARALGDAALASYRKIPEYGARSTKAGNACVHALAALSGISAIAQLQRVLQRVKLPSQGKEVEKALETAARAQRYSREDLDELAVPTFGLSGGVVRRDFGDYSAQLAIEGSDRVNLRWIRPDGKAQKSVPAPIKREFRDQVKDLEQTRKGIGEALSAHRTRIERLLMGDRAWSYTDWRERYLDHPLLSLLAHRLLWTFEEAGDCIVAGYLDGNIVGQDDRPLDWLHAETQVRLWHPLASPANEVFAWREWLERHEITQPFKQAHREIYILTDAERETATYSNRFAAHILRQHQFSALCQQRGWTYRLQGAWDGFNVPSLELPAAGLRAEYWIEGIEHGDELSHAGIYLYAATDQVRFVDSVSGESVRLDDIPRRVFSEVMRDVDLFVSVSSIGADPNWLDGGPGRMEGHGDYWWDFSFGELNESAESRRDALARLLPRMKKIEGRWDLDGRFLKLRGELRSYKIHLGSGNILMEPNDQYLCIVPGRGARGDRRGDGLFLPFEGDQTLSVILSKALMLADDANISDPSIAAQITEV